MKALRLPTRDIHGRLFGSLPQPTRFLLSFVSRLGAPGSLEFASWPGPFVVAEPPGPLRKVSARSHDHPPFLSLLTLPIAAAPVGTLQCSPARPDRPRRRRPRAP